MLANILVRRVLITTDVWARGIDVQQVSLVINYDLPAYVSCLCLSQCTPLNTRDTGIVRIIFIELVGQDALVAKV